MEKIKKIMFALCMLAVLTVAGCTSSDTVQETTVLTETAADIRETDETKETQPVAEADKKEIDAHSVSVSTDSSVLEIPEYTDQPYAVVNNNTPFFTADEITDVSFESYSDLDSLGRCGAAFACLGQDLMPTEKRGDISSVKPTGWKQNKYDFVDGGYIYNRCHLIAFELAAENANEKNLITGTRYFNVTGMLPFENMAADYIKETGNHVMYRVTPIFNGDNLLAEGVLMEALSVEDNGDDICFCVFCYNVQPGVSFNYATGDNWADGSDTTEMMPDETITKTLETQTADIDEFDINNGITQQYILNTNSMKFHYPDCSSVKDMNEANKELYTGSRDNLILQGYEPCGSCKP